MDAPASNAFIRAIREGRVLALGGFRPPDSPPFWGFLAYTWRGRQWLATLTPDESQRFYRIRLVDAMHWRDWDGNPDGHDALSDGTNPKRFFDLKQADHITYKETFDAHIYSSDYRRNLSPRNMGD